MHKLAILLLAGALTVGLSGCSEEITPSDRQGDPTPDVDSASSQTEGDRSYLAYVRAELLSDSGISDWSDGQLIDIGHAACDQLYSGVAIEDVRVIDNEAPARSGYYMDSLTARSGAEQFYCPDTL